jgi:hypothetical protein
VGRFALLLAVELPQLEVALICRREKQMLPMVLVARQQSQAALRVVAVALEATSLPTVAVELQQEVR